MNKKYVYLFNEGNAQMRELLGGKGANLAEMTRLGLPIPKGFTITTEACTSYYDNGKVILPEIETEILKNLEILENVTNKRFGNKENPLLVSVRSGARASMPGMMDTVLNLGINDEVVEAMAKKNERFAYDSYRRFIQMFSDVVMEIDKSKFEKIIDDKKNCKNIQLDTEFSAQDLKELIDEFKQLYKQEKNEDFPQDPVYQMKEVIKAVFKSWENPRAIVYRRLNDIPSSWGTAVNVQEMVFGNMGEDCGTGVAFTRNPSTGENAIYGEFLMNAQGEDVVAGIRTPQPMEQLKDVMPEIYEEFVGYAKKLETYFKDMQDMEFTIEKKRLYILQTRNGKRTALAALKVAVDLVEEGVCTKEEALLKIDPKQLDQLLHPIFDPEALKTANPITTGLPASPGAGTGKLVFSAESANEWYNNGEKDLILVRLETSPEDIEGMNVCKGVLTIRGGMTSHAAVVARGMGTCCVAGCSELIINEEARYIETKDGQRFCEGDYISLDGSTGKVYGEKIDTVEATMTGNFAKVMQWADEFRVLKVRANADTQNDAKKAFEFGAEGIGLCRTEHMFFEADRIEAIREMIVSKTVEQREEALQKLLPMQRGDFEKLFREMRGYPVTIRLLDPPLHEFVPKGFEEIEHLSKEMDMSIEELTHIIEELHEFNPMMGHRGCRLDVTYPEIAKMQTRAIIEAALNVCQEGLTVEPEIMIPLICELKELKYVKSIIVKTIKEVFNEKGIEINYTVGTMVEIPRAAILADDIAKEAEFFSFGTNDLTQMTYGFSRDDTGKFIGDYYEKGILEFDPFVKLDQKGVGKLVAKAAKMGRATRPELKLGICGEHGGDPSTIEFCHNIGLTYVSCSPYRVPIARLAAAQAAIKNKKE